MGLESLGKNFRAHPNTETDRSYLLSRGPRWSLRNRPCSRGWEWLGFYVNKQWLLLNNHRGPRLNENDHILKLRIASVLFTDVWRVFQYAFYFAPNTPNGFERSWKNFSRTSKEWKWSRSQMFFTECWQIFQYAFYLAQNTANGLKWTWKNLL